MKKLTKLLIVLPSIICAIIFTYVFTGDLNKDITIAFRLFVVSFAIGVGGMCKFFEVDLKEED